MGDGQPFSAVLELFESYGWRLFRVFRNERIFTKPGHWPIRVEVNHGKVSEADVVAIRTILREQDEGPPGRGRL